MKNFVLSILKMSITVIIIFLMPFMLPIILKIMLKLRFFSDIKEFIELGNVFNNIYTFACIIFGVVMLLWFFHKWKDIKEFFNSREIVAGLGNKTISIKKAEQELKDSNAAKEFISKIKQNDTKKDSVNAIEEIKQKLGLVNKQENVLCKDCNKEELEKENSRLRFFAAYNIINGDAKVLLHIIYTERYIETERFKRKIISGYKQRNSKNVKFKRYEIEKIAKNKYETIFEGLKFLNIIEPSEDDKVLKLTKEGKEFVERYIESKGVV